MKISIVTATYNSASTLKDTLESVLRQDYSDWEHLIIDGGSKDDTLEIVKEYEPRYNGRLRWISEKDKGIYDAMNKGVHMATGDVVGILNSDDFYRDNHVLSDIVEGIADVDAVYGDVVYVDWNEVDKEVRYYSSAGFRTGMFRKGLMPAHPTFYCRKKVYDDCGDYATDIRIAADFDFLVRSMLVKGISTRYIPRALVSMRAGGISSSGFKSYKQSYKDKWRVLRQNGVVSNPILLGSGYVLKALSLLKFKLTKK